MCPGNLTRIYIGPPRQRPEPQLICLGKMLCDPPGTREDRGVGGVLAFPSESPLSGYYETCFLTPGFCWGFRSAALGVHLQTIKLLSGSLELARPQKGIPRLTLQSSGPFCFGCCPFLVCEIAGSFGYLYESKSGSFYLYWRNQSGLGLALS